MRDRDGTVVVRFGKGDILKFNDIPWQVTGIPVDGEKTKYLVSPVNGAGQRRVWSEEDIAERINYSKELHLVRADYVSIIDY